jgi:serine/threonine protein kinase/WD40 repeat protein
MQVTNCPTDDRLRQFLDGQNAGEGGRIAAHVEDCPDCQGRLDRLVAAGLDPSWARMAAGRPAEGTLDPTFLESLRSLVPRAAVAPERPPPPAPDEPPPIRLGAFEILGEIGRGGMAVVYKARQPQLDRIVALKRLRPREGETTDFARFRREAETIARVPHPFIVQVFEVGEDDGSPFLVLEYIGGGSLADFLGKGAPVDPRSAAAFLANVAKAVHHAHDHGVIHRDLKPSNILLAPSRDHSDHKPSLDAYEPKVVDFGLARRTDDDRGLTQPDMLAGTPAYLAPEQLNPSLEDLSPASDVYSLGVILYEMLTGRPPLVGPTAMATLRLVETVEPVPPRRLQPHLPRDLEAVCLKCLAKDPRRRYALAADLAADLDRFLAGKPTVARPLNAITRAVKLVRQHPWAAAGLTLLALAITTGVTGILWQWRVAEHARTKLQIALDAEADQRRDAEENLYFGRLAQAVALWESGETAQARSLLAACRPTEGRTDLRGWEWSYLDRQFRPETRVFDFTHWVFGLAFLPTEAGRPAELALAIGRPKMNLDDPILPGDGLAGFVHPFDPRSTVRPGPSLTGAATAVAVHPGGKLVAWGTNNGSIVVGRATGDTVVHTIPVPAIVGSLRYVPSGSLLLATTNDGKLRAFDAETGTPRYDTPVSVGSPWVMAVHPDGKCIAAGGEKGIVRLLEPGRGSPVADLEGHAGGVASLAFSADGTVLAAGCQDGSLVLWETASRRELRRIPNAGGPAYAIAFRSDGTVLAVGGADRTVRLYDVATQRLLTTYRGHESSVRSLAFGPGNESLLSGGQDGFLRVWDATRDVRGRLIPFQRGLNDASFCPTPNGLHVAAASTDGFVRSWSAASGHEIGQFTPKLSRRQAYPRRFTTFLHDGRQLVGIDGENPSALLVFDTDTGRVRTRLPNDSPVQVLGSDADRRVLVWATQADDGVIVHWGDPVSSTPTSSIRIPVRGVTAVTLEPKTGQLAVVTTAARGEDQVLWVFDTTGVHPPGEITRYPVIFGGMTFNQTGDTFAVAVNGAIELYRTATWERVRRIPHGTLTTTCLAFSPDGRRLAAVGYDGHTILFDPAAGKRVFELRSLAPARPDDIAAESRVAFSPDGNWLLSTNWDGSVNVWDGRPR